VLAVAIALAVAAAIVFVIARRSDDGPVRLARADGTPSTCMQAPTDPPAAAGTAHPAERFARPGDEVPRLALGHVIADGFVVILYRHTLPAREREKLRGWVEGTELAVFGAPSLTQRAPVRAVTRERDLTCTTVDLDALTLFRDIWLRESLSD
jgi:Protein of unknown function (DUF3105)